MIHLNDSTLNSIRFSLGTIFPQITQMRLNNKKISYKESQFLLFQFFFCLFHKRETYNGTFLKRQ